MITLYKQYKDFYGEKDQLENFAKDVVDCPKMELWGISVKELTKYLYKKSPGNYSDLVSSIYEYYAHTYQPGARRWGDKNNFFLNHIVTIANIFPEAKFLHIVRDGRDVACSYRDMSNIVGKYAPNHLPNSVIKAAHHWRNNLSKIRQSFDYIGWEHCHELKYKDLVANPEESLAEICEFLDVPYSSEMLSFHKQNKEKNLEPEVFSDWKSRTQEKLSSSRVERWRTDMFPEDILLFEGEAKDMLKTYDYSVASLKGSWDIKMLQLFYRVTSSLVNILRAIRTFLRKYRVK